MHYIYFIVGIGFGSECFLPKFSINVEILNKNIKKISTIGNKIEKMIIEMYDSEYYIGESYVEEEFKKSYVNGVELNKLPVYDYNFLIFLYSNGYNFNGLKFS